MLAPIPATPMPTWVSSLEVAGAEVCGIGIAGRTYQTEWKKAIALATERANVNLAGSLESSVIEAQIVEETTEGRTMEHARGVSIDPALIESVTASAKTETWYDVHGEGPAGEVGFTYAKSCVPASVAASKLDVPAKKLKQRSSGVNKAGQVPEWIDWIGSQRGARMCAVGYSDPGFHADAVVETVVEDLRGQLVSAARSVVMSAAEEKSICSGVDRTVCRQSISELTAAATEAVSKGVVVTHFWFDKTGIGPRKRKNSVYGWGCVYPVVAVANAAPPPEKAETQKLDPATIEKVKEHAEAMFEELDQEEFKRRASGADVPRS